MSIFNKCNEHFIKSSSSLQPRTKLLITALVRTKWLITLDENEQWKSNSWRIETQASIDECARIQSKESQTQRLEMHNTASSARDGGSEQL